MNNKLIEKITGKYVVLGAQLLATLFLLGAILKLNMLPMKYLIILIAFLVILLVGMFFLINDSKKNIRNIVSKVISIIISIVLVFGSIYVLKGDSVIDSITGAHTQTHSYSIVVLEESTYQELEDVKGKNFGTVPFVSENSLKKVMIEMEDAIGEITTKQYEDYASVAKSLYNGDVDAIILYEAYRGHCEEEFNNFSNETRIIKTYDYEEIVEIEKNEVDVASQAFSIYISGIDTFGKVSTVSRSDVNMIMTVNPATKQILLTSIPRDYYVPLSLSGVNDKLTHSGIYGVSETIRTVENYFGIDINYYVRVNFTSLINIVDVVGGIEVHSDMTIPKLGVVEGKNYMDGKKALAFSRERYAYQEGDNHRIQNQQVVLAAIINKVISPAIITKYSSILEAVDGSFETSLDSGDIAGLVKMQLDDMSGWNIVQNQVSGTGSYSTTCYAMPGYNLYVMIPNEQSVAEAVQKIEAVLAGEVVE